MALNRKMQHSEATCAVGGEWQELATRPEAFRSSYKEYEYIRIYYIFLRELICAIPFPC